MKYVIKLTTLGSYQYWGKESSNFPQDPKNALHCSDIDSALRVLFNHLGSRYRYRDLESEKVSITIEPYDPPKWYVFLIVKTTGRSVSYWEGFGKGWTIDKSLGQIYDNVKRAAEDIARMNSEEGGTIPLEWNPATDNIQILPVEVEDC